VLGQNTDDIIRIDKLVIAVYGFPLAIVNCIREAFSLALDELS
jgi:hypothetical protein